MHAFLLLVKFQEFKIKKEEQEEKNKKREERRTRRKGDTLPKREKIKKCKFFSSIMYFDFYTYYN